VSHVSSLYEFATLVDTSSAVGVNKAQLVGTQDGRVIVPVYDWVSFLGQNFKKLPGACFSKDPVNYWAGKSPGKSTLTFWMFLEAPVIFDPVNLSGNLPSNLWEVTTSCKVTRKSQMLQNKNKMVARGGLFCLVRRPLSYQRRPFIANMADCKVIERFRLSRARIEWLVEEPR